MGQNIVKRFFIRVLATIGAVVILAVLLGALCVVIAKKSVPSKVILEVDLEKHLVEYVPDDPVARIVSGRTPTMLNLIEALQRASTDHRVVGLIARVGEAGLAAGRHPGDSRRRHRLPPFRQTRHRLRRDVRRRKQGPTARIISPPRSTRFTSSHRANVGLAGLMAETPFLRGTLDKLGLVPRMDHRAEYKNAMNELTEKKYTPAHKEATEKIVDSVFGQLVAGIAEARKMSTNDVRALINRGPFLADEALRGQTRRQTRLPRCRVCRHQEEGRALTPNFSTYRNTSTAPARPTTRAPPSRSSTASATFTAARAATIPSSSMSRWAPTPLPPPSARRRTTRA